MGITATTLKVNGLDMHVVMEGAGPDVLLLHGFPDTHAIWRHQVPALAAAGFRVIAPDLRGCGLTSMPSKVSDYHLTHLVADVIALLDVLGIAKVRLVAHDWGAVIGWQLALQHPERVERYCALSVGHPSCYATGGLKQKLKGYYIALFQIPWLPERALKLCDWAPLRWLTRCSHEMDHWRAALARPGRMRAGINYYRANLGLIVPRERGCARVPVLGIYSSQDIALVEAQMTRSAQYCKAGWRYIRFDGVGHWIASEAPQQLNPVLIDFLQ